MSTEENEELTPAEDIIGDGLGDLPRGNVGPGDDGSEEVDGPEEKEFVFSESFKKEIIGKLIRVVREDRTLTIPKGIEQLLASYYPGVELDDVQINVLQNYYLGNR